MKKKIIVNICGYYGPARINLVSDTVLIPETSIVDDARYSVQIQENVSYLVPN